MTRRRAGSASGTSAASAHEPTGSLRRGSSREASLVIVYGTELGRRCMLGQSTFTIGRSSSCDLLIDQDAVSRRHAKITYASGRYSLVDLGSSNGTRVNDRRTVEHPLEDGDRIQIGQTFLAFLSGEDAEARFQEEIYRLMTLDGLTAVFNKRYFCETLDRELARALRYGRPLSLVVFDVDGLDDIRAAHGPLAVDTALAQLAAAIRLKLRSQDVFGRLGPNSFAILLPEIGLPGAARAAEKARGIAETAALDHEGTALACTLSLGTAELSKELSQQGQLLAAAEAARDQAVRAGGNRATAHDAGARSG